MSYEICNFCVMDSTASEFKKTPTGCNFCDRARQSLLEIEGEKHLLLERIHTMRDVKSEYDCLIGLSGGVDSSYALLKALEMDLRPLCFSVDTGWNDRVADENIMKLVEGFGLPFFRYVIDIPKFLKLQASFLESGTKNVEIPTDHILMAVTMDVAREYGIKTIISGGNVATESIMPESWGYQPRDLTHIKDIYKRFRGEKLGGLPTYSLLRFNWDKWVLGIKTFYILDYLDYNRADAIKELERRVGFVTTGDKHEENVWTKWFQSFYLYQKFGIDKRKAHLSSLIVSGQLDRATALETLLKNPVYPEIGLEKRVMSYPKHKHTEYKTNEFWFHLISKVIRAIR